MTLRIEKCRISQKGDLVTVLDLGVQALTGVFNSVNSHEICEPLELVWSPSSGLLQLGHSYSLSEMYGSTYGYRTSLNKSMVDHVQCKVTRLLSRYSIPVNSCILDIGSNDGTLLNYVDASFCRVGVDPTIPNFEQYYDERIIKVPTFFSLASFLSLDVQRPRLITSLSMFYDLDDPSEFVSSIKNVLHPEGLWHFEQSYVLSMINSNSYDTVCHEHYEFYSVSVINNLLAKSGMKIIDIEFNKINGGSIAITAAHAESSYLPKEGIVSWCLQNEILLGLNTIDIYLAFAERAKNHKHRLQLLLRRLVDDGYKVNAYGASTKGNVLLQYCGINSNLIGTVGEINPSKFGCLTPGSRIPIVPEQEILNDTSDFILVLPWHFRDNIISKESSYLANGGKFIFPFPDIEIV